MSETVFVLQKIVLRLLFPVSIALILAGIGLVVWRRRTASFVCIVSSFAFVLVTSIPVTGLLLVRSLESEAGGYAHADRLIELRVRHIVVLSGHFYGGNLTSSDKIGCSVLRLIEGIRLLKRIPGSKLVVTGGKVPGLSSQEPIAMALAETAYEMGVPRDRVILEAGSWTTEDQARLCAPIVGKRPFALVTSAIHMPRSMLIFRQAGLNPVSAPAHFVAKEIPFSYETLMPQSSGLLFTQMACKEYLATWWALAKAGLGRTPVTQK